MGFVNGPDIYLYLNNNPVNYIDPYGLMLERLLETLEDNSLITLNKVNWTAIQAASKTVLGTGLAIYGAESGNEYLAVGGADLAGFSLADYLASINDQPIPSGVIANDIRKMSIFSSIRWFLWGKTVSPTDYIPGQSSSAHRG